MTYANRCALVMSRTLGLNPSAPEEATWVGMAEVLPAFKNDPTLKNYYIISEQLAKRLEKEWGPPEVYIAGKLAEKYIREKRGIIFIENRWMPGTGRGLSGYKAKLSRERAKINVVARALFNDNTPEENTAIMNAIEGPTVDHIDVWNGERTAAGEDGGYTFDTIAGAEFVWLWRLRG